MDQPSLNALRLDFHEQLLMRLVILFAADVDERGLLLDGIVEGISLYFEEDEDLRPEEKEFVLNYADGLFGILRQILG